MIRLTFAALLLLACLFTSAQGLEDTFDDGISTDKNLIGINVGGLYGGLLDIRYTRLIDRNNAAASEGVEFGIGIGIGDYRDPIMFSERETIDGDEFDPNENLSGHTRLSIGWYSLPGRYFGSSSIGYGGGFNFAYTILNYDPVEFSDPLAGDVTIETSGWTLASSFHLNIHGSITDHLRFTVAAGPAYLLGRWSSEGGSFTGSDYEPDGQIAITGQAQLAYSF